MVVLISLSMILLINIGVANLRVEGDPLPEYGTWTGIPTLQHKFSLLREFASQGPVDAVVLGSSVADHGVSAEVLSRDLSQAYGRPFRVFNFSTGAGDLRAFPLIYKIVRAVAKPKQLWISFPAQQNTGEELIPQTPEYTLVHAPVGTALRYPWLIPASFQLYQLPLVRDARALSDWVIYRRFVNRPVSLLDVYDVSSFGDTRSFLLYPGTEALDKYIQDRRDLVVALGSQYAQASDEDNKNKVYFSRNTLAAIDELRAMAAADDCPITLLAHDTSAGFAAQDGEYLVASKVFLKALGERFGARVIDVLASFRLADHNFADSSHLNYMGADEISSMMAARIANRPLPPNPNYAFPSNLRRGLPRKDIPPYSALVLRREFDPGAALQLQYVQSKGVAPVPSGTRVGVVAMLPDNSTVTVPARVVTRGRVVADTSALPAQSNGQVLLLQLTAAGGKWGGGMNIPLASYRWLAESYVQDISSAKVLSDASSYTPLETIRASWTGIRTPTAKDWIGVFPLGAGSEARLAWKATRGGVSGTLELPSGPAAKPGQYELRLFEDNGWEPVASSMPFSIVPLEVTLESASTSVRRGAAVHAVWNKLKPFSKDDWVGLFPHGASDQSRLSFAFTGGSSEGGLDLPVPINVPLGRYELRLYAAGGWSRIAMSAPFDVVE